MGDKNPICTLGDYSKPSHEGYMNTIKLLVGNNVVPLRSDTIQLVQNGCSFHGLRSEDPNQHLKDFLKLVDLLDLDGANRERTLLRNDILMFQKHHGESLSKAWTRFKDLLQKSLIMASIVGFKSKFFMIMLLKELTTSRAPKKVLIREEAKFLVTKNVNSIYLTRGEEERSKKTDVMTGDDIEKPTKTEMKMPVKEAEKEDEAENEPNKKAGKEETTEEPSSQPVKYYLKHRIN
ncbi:hypothetical protein Tco_0586611 [Tanacetum coccineum]